MEKLFYEVEMPLIYVLSSMETEGFRVDSETLKELQSRHYFYPLLCYILVKIKSDLKCHRDFFSCIYIFFRKL